MAVIGTASYKGKTYNLMFLGATKFGKRAKLAFSDGSKEFWVDASLVSCVQMGSRAPVYTPTAGGSRSYSSGGNGLGRRTGCSCGSQEGGSKDTDCRTCRFDQDDN